MPPAPPSVPIFFATAAEFRAWLEQHHDRATELVLGFNKKGSGLGGITYAEALDEALCFGWIDGILRRIDDKRHCLRFTPRKARSIWSLVNVGHVERLEREGRMHPSGRAAFAARTPERTGVYTFEQSGAAKLPAAFEKRFRAERAAWEFFRSQSPGYRRSAVFWVIGAKREATREKRLAQLIEDSTHARRLAHLAR
jgi:uncharacterized protein YdeI (YjbR/CyaY-like superfamily)